MSNDYNNLNSNSNSFWGQGGGAQKIGGTISGLASIGTTAYGTYGDIQNAKSYIKKARSYMFKPQLGNDSYDAIKRDYYSWSPLSQATPEDLGYSDTKGWMNTLSAAGTGAATGAAFGGIGAVVGALGGLGAGIWGMIAGKKKAEEQTDRLNAAIQNVNNFNSRMFDLRYNNTKNDENLRLLSNAQMLRGMGYAKGGPIRVLNRKVLSPFGNRFDEGGGIDSLMHSNGADWSNGFVYIGAGGSHEENPNGGTAISYDQEGVPNLTEQGEVVYRSKKMGTWAFSDRLTIPKEDKKALGIKGGDNTTYADGMIERQKVAGEMPFDPIEQRGMEAFAMRLAQSQEKVKQIEDTKEKIAQQMMYSNMGDPNFAAFGGKLLTKKGKKFKKGGKVSKTNNRRDLDLYQAGLQFEQARRAYEAQRANIANLRLNQQRDQMNAALSLYNADPAELSTRDRKIREMQMHQLQMEKLYPYIQFQQPNNSLNLRQSQLEFQRMQQQQQLANPNNSLDLQQEQFELQKMQQQYQMQKQMQRSQMNQQVNPFEANPFAFGGLIGNVFGDGDQVNEATSRIEEFNNNRNKDNLLYQYVKELSKSKDKTAYINFLNEIFTLAGEEGYEQPMYSIPGTKFSWKDYEDEGAKISLPSADELFDILYNDLTRERGKDDSRVLAQSAIYAYNQAHKPEGSGNELDLNNLPYIQTLEDTREETYAPWKWYSSLTDADFDALLDQYFPGKKIPAWGLDWGTDPNKKPSKNVFWERAISGTKGDGDVNRALMDAYNQHLINAAMDQAGASSLDDVITLAPYQRRNLGTYVYGVKDPQSGTTITYPEKVYKNGHWHTLFLRDLQNRVYLDTPQNREYFEKMGRKDIHFITPAVNTSTSNLGFFPLDPSLGAEHVDQQWQRFFKNLQNKNNTTLWANNPFVTGKTDKDGNYIPVSAAYLWENGLENNVIAQQIIDELIAADPNRYSWINPEKGGQSAKPYKDPLKVLQHFPTWVSAMNVLRDELGDTNTITFEGGNETRQGIPSLNVPGYQEMQDFIAPHPFAEDYYVNKTLKQQRANERGILGLVGGNRGNALQQLQTSNQNTIDKIGELGRQAEEYNRKDYLNVREYNRKSKETDADNRFKYAQLGFESAKQKQDAIARAIALDSAELTNVSQNRSANWNQLASNVGEEGRQAQAYEWFRMLHDSGVWGMTPELAWQFAQSMQNKPQQPIIQVVNGNSRAKGGKINTRKRRKNLTF